MPGTLPTAPQPKHDAKAIYAHAVDLSWTPAKSDGGFAITEYEVAITTNPDVIGTRRLTVTSVALVHIDGLNRLTLYFVRARAKNALGYGPWSDQFGFNTIADVPSSTTGTYIDAQGQTGIHYLFNGPSDGGGISYSLQVGYGTNPDSPQIVIDVPIPDVFINGLNSYTQYFVWSRAVNAVGVGPWSNRLDVRTRAPYSNQPVPTGVHDVAMTDLYYTFQDGATGGPDVLERQIGYGTDPYNIQYSFTVSGSSSGTEVHLGGLTPATTWYLWSRQRTQEGWSAWSNRTDVRMVAGARIFVDGAWREAIPFVKVDGQWRWAQPYVKRISLWNRAI